MKAIFVFIALLQAVKAIHESFNFVIPPQQRECFFEDFKVNSPSHKVEVFVAAGGKLDVLMTIHGPLSLPEVYASDFESPVISEMVDAVTESESETQTFTTNFKPVSPGTYAICLDNRHSRLVSKVVQLDVSPNYDVAPINLELGHDTETEVGEMDAQKIRDSLKSLSQIHDGLRTIQLQQQKDRHRLSLHSETNNSNYNTVFVGSIFETAVFICCAIFQIFFVRRWFSSRAAGGAPTGATKTPKNWA